MKNPTRISLHHRYTRDYKFSSARRDLEECTGEASQHVFKRFQFSSTFFLFILVYFCLLLNGPRSSYIFFTFFWGGSWGPALGPSESVKKFFFTSLSLFSPFYTLKQSTSPRVHGTFRNASAENFYLNCFFIFGFFLLSLARVSRYPLVWHNAGALNVFCNLQALALAV